MRSIIFALLCLFGGSILSAQSGGDTLSVDYVRATLADSDAMHYHMGRRYDTILKRTDASVTIIRVDTQTGVFTLIYHEAFAYPSEAVFKFNDYRAKMLAKRSNLR